MLCCPKVPRLRAASRYHVPVVMLLNHIRRPSIVFPPPVAAPAEVDETNYLRKLDGPKCRSCSKIQTTGSAGWSTEAVRRHD